MRLMRTSGQWSEKTAIVVGMNEYVSEEIAVPIQTNR